MEYKKIENLFDEIKNKFEGKTTSIKMFDDYVKKALDTDYSLVEHLNSRIIELNKEVNYMWIIGMDEKEVTWYLSVLYTLNIKNNVMYICVNRIELI
ncbi:MAG: phasin family protein [Fusobacteriaceae bacterium]|jgi:hypothetical protein|nr:phasin family protein [Fusobacteriaceae bacterium]